MIDKLLNAAMTKSDDQNTQTAAILSTAEGTPVLMSSNTLTVGVAASYEKTTRPGKDPWIEHSERNVIFKAARLGISTQGLHLHMRWFPCAECARAIAQSGISVLHCGPQPSQRDKYHFYEAAEILSSANVVILQAEAENAR